ncbi:hypothetical protein OEB94_14165 [Streptomyces sp. ICN988]|uniref:hypothetical protein n=2 Tax=Streptomyces TaxID=1883 RepID=UPI0021E3A38D|nr:hypothetical protein [Streptomyces sp. ICN988]MCV2460422.1 hypothetical protein [Streptomyces sp. ICN988]
MKIETSTFEVTRDQDDDAPIDVELIQDSTDAALALTLGATTRETVDARTPVLIGHLRLLMAEELGADTDQLVRQLFDKAYRVLDLTRRPTKETPTFTAYFFMREVASLTRRFLWIYTQRSGTGAA